MKKLIALLLALAMLLALAAGCTVNVGSEKTEEKTEKTEQSSKTKDKDKDEDEDEDDDEDEKESGKSGKSGGSLAGLFGFGKKDPDQPLDGPGSINEPAEPAEPVTEPAEPAEPAEPTEPSGTGTAVTEPAVPELPDPFGERIAYEILDVELEGRTLLQAESEWDAYGWLYAFYAGGYGIEPSENGERTQGVGFDTWLRYYAPYDAADYCGWGQAWLQAEYWLEPYATFVNATASSELDESSLGLDHSAKMVYDGTLENAWCEGVDGYGEGECITVEFDDRYVVRAIELYAGYHKSEELYNKNSRPKELLLVFDEPEGIATETIVLDDVFMSQFFAFGKLHYCTSITIFVQSVYKGTTYDDTLISELYVY